MEQNAILNALIKHAFVTLTSSSNASNLSATSSKGIVQTCAAEVLFLCERCLELNVLLCWDRKINFTDLKHEVTIVQICP